VFEENIVAKRDEVTGEWGKPVLFFWGTQGYAYP
jgi:hypothetical protein